MRRVLRKPAVVVGFLAIGIAIGCVWGGGVLLAQTGGQRGGNTEIVKIRASVKEVLKNDHGDVDGLKLASGERVHFPPHMGKQIATILKIDDEVDVEGRLEVTPRGEQVFELTRITSGKETVRVVPPKAKDGPPAKRGEEHSTARGLVAEFAANPHGEVDGLVFKDGTIVKFPPHQSSELQKLVRVGDEVQADGRRHVTPHGDVHFHADVIRANDQQLERDEPKSGPKPPHHDLRSSVADETTFNQMLEELREIRKLLSERR